jgi:RND family efflux transporter MFP subunit
MNNSDAQQAKVSKHDASAKERVVHPSPDPKPHGSEQNASATPEKSPGKNKFIAALIIFVLLTGGLLLGFLPRWHQSTTALADMNELATPTVIVASPQLESKMEDLVLPAEILPWTEASIYARVNGYLKDWLVDIGAHVQAGQLIAEIDTPDLDQQLYQARAQLDLAKANLHLAQITDDRWQHLLKSSSVSEQDAQTKTAQRETAAASVEAAADNLGRLQQLVSYERVIAPFTGIISLRNTDIGDLIIAGNGGQQLFHIIQSDKLRVYVRVPEPNANGIRPGLKATLTTPEMPGRTFEAVLTTTSQAISSASRTLQAEFEVDNSKYQLLPYSFGELTVPESRSNPMLVLPSNTLLFRAQGLQVGVVDSNGVVQLHSVKIDRDLGTTIEIASGVTQGDQVIINPSDSLVSGIKVRVQVDTNSAASK